MKIIECATRAGRFGSELISSTSRDLTQVSYLDIRVPDYSVDRTTVLDLLSKISPNNKLGEET